MGVSYFSIELIDSPRLFRIFDAASPTFCKTSYLDSASTCSRAMVSPLWAFTASRLMT
jgi:hypothetical protein